MANTTTTTNTNDKNNSRQTSTPSPTLYVQNLCDKLKKSDLKRLLYQLFSTHGKVLDVVSLKGIKMRGQAFIVFRDLQGATQAMRYLDGTAFLDRDLKISYAKKRSFATVKQIAGDEVLYQVKLGLMDPNTLTDITKTKLTVSSAQAANMEKRKADDRKRAREDGIEEEEEEEEADEEEEDDDGNKKETVKKSKIDHEDDEEAMEEDSDSEQPVDSAAAAAVKAAGTGPVLSSEEPNPVLFLEGLPSEVTDDMMAVLFQQYPGFVSVRLVPGRTGIAFVQYDTSTQSDMAKTALDGFQLAPGIMMKVRFARKG
ncbi:hypothetical protein CROQUDRAFT_660030 [Cronartium quercuum f. sp. fusiforme G11]|uniref:RRM domain-containing protein n=1 Tax=Cronartium quercuum f. sp. fusiforme G11 TaxID=708437 RepID=A0A9P6TAB7_9BASI|nr:hypothetical protein CROQUDRAFT_660030 [Cronartium quercuum f. sp. fusiforme G11]